MASGASKSAAFMLLILNTGLYFLMIVIGSWAINHGIERSRETAATLTIPARIFPIYFPMGNLATGFFIILSLLAGIVGFTCSITGLNNVFLWNAPNLHAAYASALASLSLTLLALGFACKEINIGWTDSALRTLEVVTIIVSGTQLLCTVAIHVGEEDAVARQKNLGGRY
ncbi:AWPM-19 membrane family protein [Salix suchowensis]|nr:AWPM-19 membrane family protein [Salix suchowensis]